MTLSGGEYDQIAGYEPGSQVTDHAAIDQDQKAMEQYMAGDGVTKSFVTARKIYKEGGFSKSYAELTVPARATARGVTRPQLGGARPPVFPLFL